MGQIGHGRALTTEATWRVIQQGQESLEDLAARYETNEKTVAKWRTRGFAHDASVESALPQLPDGLQLRPSAQNPQWPLTF